MATPQLRKLDTPVVLRRNPTSRLHREMVAGGVPNTYSKSQALSQNPDDITRELGIKVYEAMLHDSQISACVTFWRAAILEDGVRFTPAVADPTEEGFEESRDLVNEIRLMFSDLDTSLDDVMWDMLNCIVFGMKVAEVVWHIKNDRLDIARIKVKPANSVALVVDQFMNVQGILGAEPNQSIPVVQSSIIEPAKILPLNKFLVMTFRPKDSDPRGTSILRPAYQAWWRKQQIIPEYMKFLSQFAGPSIIGYTPEDATMEDAVDGDTEESITPEEAMLSTILQFRNGSAATFPGGSKIDVIKNEGEGIAFVNAMAEANLEITKAVLGQELATEQSKYMARAAAQVHQDVLDTLIRQGKIAVTRALYHQIVKRWILYNWGEKYIKYAPVPSLGTVEHKDLSRQMVAIAALKRASYFAPEQMPQIDKLLGFPVRSKTAIEAEQRQLDAATRKAEEEAKPLPIQQQAPPEENKEEEQKRDNTAPRDSE